MSTAIQEAASKIDQRIRELRGELAQLEKAHSALTDVPGAGRSSRRSTSPNGRRSTTARKRGGRRVDRASEFKKVITADPTIRPSQAAKQMGISSQQVHGLIKRLRERGEITRSDKGFKVKK